MILFLPFVESKKVLPCRSACRDDKITVHMAKVESKIRFTAKLHRPAGEAGGTTWTFLRLPLQASSKLPTRSMCSVEGTFNGRVFQTTLLPDGAGGHWMKVDKKLRQEAGARVGDVVKLEIAPAAVEPEPEIPADVKRALAAAGPKVREVWADITPIARRDWLHWITSGKKAETRVKRIEVACSKLAAGSRRPCCFDRAGIASKSMSCPVAADED